jgi:hypothetical protein
MPSRRAARPRKPVRVLIGVGGLFLAVNILIIAGINQRTNSQPTVPSAIEELIPKPGDLVSPQSTFGVNLRDDLQGVLEFDGAEIPLDQLVTQPTLGIITFSPGPDKQLTKLPQGSHTITVVYWSRGAKREAGTTSYSWTFKVGA